VPPVPEDDRVEPRWTPTPSVLELTGMGRWEWDVAGGTVSCDALASDLLGHGRTGMSTSLPAFVTHVVSEDRAVLLAAFELAGREGSPLIEEFRVRLPGGTIRWVRVRGAVVRDRAGRPVQVVGLAGDSTSLPARAEGGRDPAHRTRAGVLLLDQEWTVVHGDRIACDLLAVDQDRLRGSVLWDAVPGIDTAFGLNCRLAVERRRPVSFETDLMPVPGRVGVRVLPTDDGLALYLHAVATTRGEERERMAIMRRLEHALTRGRQLLELTQSLETSMTPDEVATTVTARLHRSLDVTRAGIALVDGGRLRSTGIEGDDPVRPGFHDVSHPEAELLEAVARSSRPLFHERVEDAATDLDEAAAWMAKTGAAACAHLPLVAADGEVLGALVLSWAESHPMSSEERDFLVTIAGHCAQALHRAMRYEQQHTVASALQNAVLPDRLPSLPGWELAARYVPATSGVEVCGDWYDAFWVSADRLGLVVGDAAGHGLLAARVMSSLRNALRAYALLGEGPGAVLGRLDRMLYTLDPEAMATAVYLELDPVTGTGRWASAGHPPLLWARTDGIRIDDTTDVDPPLGCLRTHPLRERTFSVADGEGLLLYTDGLVERRTESISVGLHRLESTVVRARHAARHGTGDRLTYQVFVDDLLAELLGPSGSLDDVCVVSLYRGAWSPDRYGVSAPASTTDLPARRAPAAGTGAEDDHPRLSRVLDPQPQSAGDARRLARRALATWGRGAAMDSVTLIVSEMVTNAVQHAGTPLRLDLELDGDLVRVSVTDAAPGRPRQAAADPLSERGRGVHLVDSLSRRWGTQDLPGGKRVWAELDAGLVSARPVTDTSGRAAVRTRSATGSGRRLR